LTKVNVYPLQDKVLVYLPTRLSYLVLPWVMLGSPLSFLLQWCLDLFSLGAITCIINVYPYIRTRSWCTLQ